jgi:hypothetical protein
VNLYRCVGCFVASTSQYRPSHVALGLPDLLVFHAGKGCFWFHEVKAPGGTLRPAQQRFRETAEACGLTVLVGDDDVAKAHLVALGIVPAWVGAASGAR